MKIKVLKTGRIFTTAQWFGHNWIRAWEGRDGWYHYFVTEVEILNGR